MVKQVGKKYVIAVSGGVDSVALLDMMKQAGYDVVVAHYDHGMRLDSHKDAKFVEDLARKYGAKFETAKGHLGPDASEELAREKRYEFLRNVAKKHKGKLVTAHHGDDAVETIVHNIRRGTGWRGLAVMGAEDVMRPLLGMRKDELIDYARKRGLEWHEDTTNTSRRYTRNRIRQDVTSKMTPEQHEQFLHFRQAQAALKKAIDEELERLRQGLSVSGGYQKHFFVMAPSKPSAEVLQYIVKHDLNSSLTRPQVERLLLAIKTARVGSKHHIGNKHQLKIGRSSISFS